MAAGKWMDSTMNSDEIEFHGEIMRWVRDASREISPTHAPELHVGTHDGLAATLLAANSLLATVNESFSVTNTNGECRPFPAIGISLTPIGLDPTTQNWDRIVDDDLDEFQNSSLYLFRDSMHFRRSVCDNGMVRPCMLNADCSIDAFAYVALIRDDARACHYRTLWLIVQSRNSAIDGEGLV